jgi:hypothetical protein
MLHVATRADTCLQITRGCARELRVEHARDELAQQLAEGARRDPASELLLVEEL